MIVCRISNCGNQKNTQRARAKTKDAKSLNKIVAPPLIGLRFVFFLRSWSLVKQANEHKMSYQKSGPNNVSFSRFVAKF